MEYHIKVESEAAKGVDLLAKESGLSKQVVKQAMQKGCVWLTTEHGTQRLRRHSKVIQPGMELHFYYNIEVLNAEVPEATLVSDEGSYSIWNKPFGMLSQGSKWGDHTTIYRWAEQHLEPERSSFIVHRLDKAASGLIILAHKKKIAASLSKMFADRKIVKKYRARVAGKLIIQGEVLTIKDPIDDKEACTLVRLISYDSDKDESLLDVEIETGRKHQIRKHLVGIGHSVIGDRLYGPEITDQKDVPDLQLTACYLSLLCPEQIKQKTWQLEL